MNYATYYTKGQRVFLINATADHNDTVFEALSATITASNNQLLDLHLRYPVNKGDQTLIKPGMQFKVTTESYGTGVQFVGTVTRLEGTTCQVKPDSLIEMYQRSQMPRTDIITHYRVFCRNAPLAMFRQEWQRFSDGINTINQASLDLTDAQINLGMGGISYVTSADEPQTDLAMVFVVIHQNEPPVCAVAELLWKRSLPDAEGIAVGRRFVVISKADQERIKTFVQRKQKNDKKKKPEKTYWELLDRMSHQR